MAARSPGRPSGRPSFRPSLPAFSTSPRAFCSPPRLSHRRPLAPLRALLPQRRRLPEGAQGPGAAGDPASSRAGGASAGASAASRAAAPHSPARETARGGEETELRERRRKGAEAEGGLLPHRPRQQQRHRPAGLGEEAARGGFAEGRGGLPPASPLRPTARLQAGASQSRRAGGGAGRGPGGGAGGGRGFACEAGLEARARTGTERPRPRLSRRPHPAGRPRGPEPPPRSVRPGSEGVSLCPRKRREEFTAGLDLKAAGIGLKCSAPTSSDGALGSQETAAAGRQGVPTPARGLELAPSRAAGAPPVLSLARAGRQSWRGKREKWPAKRPRDRAFVKRERRLRRGRTRRLRHRLPGPSGFGGRGRWGTSGPRSHPPGSALTGSARKASGASTATPHSFRSFCLKLVSRRDGLVFPGDGT